MVRDPYRYFRIEARELLDQLGQGVLDLEKGAPGADLVSRLLRLAHTLKGAARVVKRTDIADGAHAIEGELAGVRGTAEPVGRERIDRLLARLDEMGAQVAGLTIPSDAPPSPQVESSRPDDLFRAFRPDVEEMDEFLDTMTEARGQLTALRSSLSRVERARQLTDAIVEHLGAETETDAGQVDHRSVNRRTRAAAQELWATFGTLERELSTRLDYLGREFDEARHAAERLRLVPASALFTVLQRTARDAATALGTEVAFEGRGGTVRVDIQILGVMQGALLQLVRNAVAHGVEPAADRVSAGKHPAGRVVIEIVRRGQRLIFRCSDDGRGIDFEAVRAFARRQGVPAADIDGFAPSALMDLLLKGGISTSRTITTVSGRGIGLDIVREAAEQLGGVVRATTDAGRGTTVEIDVPFTVASLPALKVESGGVTVLLPLDAVRGCVRITPDAILRTGHGQSILHDGDTIPLGTLDRAVAPGTATPRTSGPASIVLLQEGQAKAAFVIDRVLGSTTVVVRPLPELAPAAAFVAGASLDDEGVPQIVLDPETLIAAADHSLAVRDESKPARPFVLVIDDSLTTRMLEQSILESAGYPVDLATSGEEALKKALERRYSLFLVDVEMPGMDGFTFIERTKAEPALRDIPSILVTSRNSPEDRRRGQEVGARGYVVKGEFDQRALLERIRGLVG